MGVFSVMRILGAAFAPIALGLAALAMLGPFDPSHFQVRTASAAASATAPAAPAVGAPVTAAAPIAAPVAPAPVAAPTPVSAPAPAAPATSTAALSADIPAIALRASVDRSGAPLQCAIYARRRTNIQLTGAARTWWPQAEGRYRRSHAPEAGAVLVMGGTSAGHVAVVTQVLNAREALVDHANWLNTGEIIRGALVRDVSAANDWSAVRVWHPPTSTLGLRVYPAYGFVHPEAAPQAS